MKGLKIALFGLAVAVGGVLGATTGVEETAAAPCCSSCDPAYTRCINGCGGDINCELSCEAKWDRCTGYCSSSC
ncbi:hypothetical protein [Archangium lansingense]|uniref:Uncharacterized protein n=1 Tax=Archangium lansingense TaxID=2995310 RepID=A0ABT4AM26_9BACT|nr:hypothetical protein [Archangium lansinium]MCY1081894.1 hypothetical protein [Archangium lansinium]